MDVGRITRLNGIYNYNSVTKVGPAGLYPVGRRSGEAQQTQAVNAVETKEPETLPGHIAAVYKSADGDLAEISNKAMDLWQAHADSNSASPSLPFSQQPEIRLPFDYHPDLPSPFLDWEELINSAEPPAVLNNDAPVIQPPETAPPSNLPAFFTPADTPSAPAASPDALPPPTIPQNTSIPGGGSPSSDKPSFKTQDIGEFKFDPVKPKGECKTCESRRYVDRSDDSSVSYQTPTKLNPGTAAASVASHENEHVTHEKGKAQREGREIVNQTVTFTYDTCPECGRSFVSGGNTHTTSVKKADTDGKQ